MNYFSAQSCDPLFWQKIVRVPRPCPPFLLFSFSGDRCTRPQLKIRKYVGRPPFSSGYKSAQFPSSARLFLLCQLNSYSKL